jgi:hypothetical protein
MNETKTNLTLKQRRRLQGNVQSEQGSDKQASGKELPRIVAILLLLLAFGGGTALGMIYFRPDPALQEIDDMMAIAMDENTPRDLQGELMGERRAIADELPANRRRGRGMRDPEDWEMARAPKFLALSPADQLARLKKEIEGQKEWEARQAERAAEAAADAAAKPADSSKSDNSNSNNGQGRRGGGTDQQRVQRQEQRIANNPPQQRAQGGLYGQMRNAVRQMSQ